MEINHKKIKDLRIEKGFSQEELADRAGLNLRTIQRIENGATVPRGDSLQRIASALDVSPDLFVNTARKKDDNLITILNLSQLGFLIFPPLSIIIPLFIWMKKKEQIDHVESVGKSVLNFQISWNILLIILIVIFFISMATKQPGEIFTLKTLLSIPLIILLYFYNLIMILANTVSYKNKGKVRYFPSMKFLN
jgi:transcriptional regulator with XRE-family HTH domain